MPINIHLLRATLAKVEEEAAKPGRGLWDQEDWTEEHECGTAYCFGGWAAILDGWKPVASGEQFDEAVPQYMVEKDGDRMPLWDAAKEALDIPYYTGLFLSENSIGDLRRIVAEVIEREIAKVEEEVW